MQRTIRTAALLWMLAAGLAQAGNIGAGWTMWRTKEAGDDKGSGFKLTMTEKGANGALELRFSQFSDLSEEGGPRALKLTPIEVGSRFPLSKDGPLEIYMGLGVGYYMMDYEDIPVSDEFGYYGLLGVDFAFGKSFQLFGEAVYRKVTVKPDGADTFKLDGVGAFVGLGYTW